MKFAFPVPPNMTEIATVSFVYHPAPPQNGIHLRPMEAYDEPAFRKLYFEMRGPELSITQWPDARKQVFCDSQYTLQDKHYRQCYACFSPWAICDQDAVIGRLYLATFDGLLILMDITIAESARNKGLGTVLLRDLISQADVQGRTMQLHVEPDNPARRLYKRMGFIETGEPDSSAIYQEMRRAPRTAV